MEHFSKEYVPAIAAEVDIGTTLDIGTKRKRGSVTSKSKRPRKRKQAAKVDKENQPPGSLTLGSRKASTSGAAEADTISTTKEGFSERQKRNKLQMRY